jgi:dihydroflavonol-4-reductase
LSQWPIDIRFGDVRNGESLYKAMEGVDVVFHAAAIYQLCETHKKNGSKKEDPIIRTAVEGTENLYRAASRNGIKKIVFTSSVETIGSTYDRKTLLDESSFSKDDFYRYTTAKIQSERAALRLADAHNLHTVICNPSTIIGKDDYKPTPSNRMLLNLIKFNSFYLDAGQSLVDVEDVANGHLKALTKGRHLERYILSGDNLEIRDLINLIRKNLNIRRPSIKLNKPSLYAAACVMGLICGIVGKEPLLTRAKVKRTAGSYSYYNYHKAKKELDYSPKKISDSLPSTINWLMGRFK